ncbi:predicted protein [Nematostella vectensis]|uniref:Uncharacterized protein n=1 Tax=Nematostella vectensis TaxID=45351 RepID=A7RHQ3_NEMVE|nr:protein phosphatase 1 regulatory subunit 27 [Nematostella vectensis]EDO48893.1 predicted protein [Nematostella vectensis]|eukprot:XP_001640956.1 predicted protein [Nematostella vectensis]
MDRKVKFPHELVFHEMVKEGDSAEMSMFLKRPSVDPKSIINGTQGNQGPALHQLVFEGNLKCVRMLVNLGADVNMQNEEGFTPLHYCALSNNFDMAKFLMKKSANPDIADYNGKTPVDYTEDFDLIELFLMFSPDEQRRKSMSQPTIEINHCD